MTPQRIQRRRTKGWRMPENTVYVGRPGKWGNPWKPYSDAQGAVDLYRYAVTEQEVFLWKWEYGALPSLEELRAELAGKDLVCWCPLDHPCHADVLLEIANGDAP